MPIVTHRPMMTWKGIPVRGLKRCEDCGLNETFWNRFPECGTRRARMMSWTMRLDDRLSVFIRYFYLRINPAAGELLALVTPLCAIEVTLGARNMADLVYSLGVRFHFWPVNWWNPGQGGSMFRFEKFIGWRWSQDYRTKILAWGAKENGKAGR